MTNQSISESQSYSQKLSLVDGVEKRRLAVIPTLAQSVKSQFGQFMTPAVIAKFMASQFLPIAGEEVRLLDPGAGVGSLTAAFVEYACKGQVLPKRISVTVFEIDPALVVHLSQTLKECAQFAKDKGVEFVYRIEKEDFIERASNIISGKSLLEGITDKLIPFTHVILNPPYKKINSKSKQRLLIREAGIETSNLYSAFVALSIKLLSLNGEIVAITPRSFCNGPYFLAFRKLLVSCLSLDRIHSFEARDVAFQDDDVLQENIIYHAVKATQSETVTLTYSEAINLEDIKSQEVLFSEVIRPGDKKLVIHIPNKTNHREVRKLIESLPFTLDDLGISVSTGPVVDFRLKEFIHKEPQEGTVPLVYPAHFKNGQVIWPRNDIDKPNTIENSKETKKWLRPNGFYTLTRRFSSKEERRRIVVAIYNPGTTTSTVVGFENHVNFFHIKKQGLEPSIAKGLAIYLGSTIVDEFFRLFNGHTQVNVADLKSLRYPSIDQLTALGNRVKDNELPSQEIIDQLVSEILLIQDKFGNGSG